MFARFPLHAVALLMRLGDYERGWREYQWVYRGSSVTDERSFSAPAWQGEPLNGEKVLFYTWQGSGDDFHFVR